VPSGGRRVDRRVACEYAAAGSVRQGPRLPVAIRLPEHRGQGVGRALLAEVASRAAASGGRLEWAVLEWNEPALRFYAGLGARPLKGWATHRLVGEPLYALAAEAGASSSSSG